MEISETIKFCWLLLISFCSSMLSYCPKERHNNILFHFSWSLRQEIECWLVTYFMFWLIAKWYLFVGYPLAICHIFIYYRVTEEVFVMDISWTHRSRYQIFSVFEWHLLVYRIYRRHVLLSACRNSIVDFMGLVNWFYSFISLWILFFIICQLVEVNFQEYKASLSIQDILR